LNLSELAVESRARFGGSLGAPQLFEAPARARKGVLKRAFGGQQRLRILAELP
jgi:hypothetical protein